MYDEIEQIILLTSLFHHANIMSSLWRHTQVTWLRESGRAVDYKTQNATFTHRNTHIIFLDFVQQCTTQLIILEYVQFQVGL